MAEAGALQQPAVLPSSAGVTLTDEGVMYITVAETKKEAVLHQRQHR